MDPNGPETNRNGSNWACFKLFGGAGVVGLSGWGGGGVVRENENHYFKYKINIVKLRDLKVRFEPLLTAIWR